MGRPIFSTLEKISLPKISDMQIVDVSVSCNEPMAFPMFRAAPNSG